MTHNRRTTRFRFFPLLLLVALLAPMFGSLPSADAQLVREKTLTRTAADAEADMLVKQAEVDSLESERLARTATLADADAATVTLQASIDKATAERDLADGAVRDASLQLEAAKTSLDTQQLAVNEATKSLDAAKTAELDAAAADGAAADEVVRLEAELAKVQAAKLELDSVQKQLAVVADEVKLATATYDKAAATALTAQRDYDAALAAAPGAKEIAAAELQVDDAQLALDQAQARYDKAVAAGSDPDTIAKLEAELDAAKDARAKAGAELDRLNALVADAEAAGATLTKAREAEAAALTDLEAVQLRQTTLQASADKLKATVATQADVEAQLADARLAKAATARTLLSAQAAVKTAEGAYTKQAALLADATTTYDAAAKTLADAELFAAQKALSLEKAVRALAENEALIADTKLAIRTLDERLAVSKAELVALQAEVRELTAAENETFVRVPAKVTAPLPELEPIVADRPLESAELLEGSLPAGVKFDAKTLSFVGSPTTDGDVTAKIRLSDGENVEYRNITWEVAPADPVITSVVRVVPRGESLTPLLAINEGTPITAELVAGELPTGVTMNPDGSFVGTADTVQVVDSQIMITDTVTGERELRSVAFEITTRPAVETVETRSVTRGDELAAITPESTFKSISAEVVEGSLPTGVKLAEAGTLVGTPTEAGEFVAKVLFTDGVTGDREIKTVTFAVAEKDAVAADEAIAAKVGSAIAPLTRIAAENPVTAEFVDGSLPTGVKLNPDGSFEGVPTLKGEYVARILVTDTVTGDRQIRTVTFGVGESDPVETTETRAATVGEPLEALAPINDKTTTNFELADGSLPEGVKLNPDGTFEGVPLTSGKYAIRVMATDLFTGEREIRAISLTVAEKEPVVTAVVRMVTRGDAVSPLLAINDGNPMTAELVAGELPVGVTMNPDGSFAGIAETVQVVDSQILVRDSVTGDRELRSVAFEVTARPVVETAETREVTRGDELAPIAPDSKFGAYTAELAEGSLPEGVKLAEDGSLVGTPTRAGDHVARILFTDTATGDREIKTVSFAVAEKEPVPTDVTKLAKVGTVIEPLVRIAAENPIRTELVEGSLPEGVKLNPDGSFDGVPTVKGTYTASILVTDEVTGDREIRTVLFEVDVSDPVDESVIRELTVFDPVEALTPINPKTTTVFELVEGTLPEGVKMSEAGTFEGAPIAGGEHLVRVLATDLFTGERKLIAVEFTVAEKEAVPTSVIKTVTRSEAVAPLLAITEGNPFTAELVDGELPEGVTMTPDGMFIGTADVVGLTSAQILVRDSVTGDRELRSVTFDVALRPVVETTDERFVERGDLLGVVAPDADWSDWTVAVAEGRLPAGVVLAPDGRYIGTPSEAGLFVAKALFTDEATTDRELRTLIFHVAEKTPVEIDETVDGKVGEALDALAAIRPGDPISAELVEGSLPEGVTLHHDGELEGVPTHKGDFVATIMVVDEVYGDRELRTITWVIGIGDPVEKSISMNATVGDELIRLAPINGETTTAFELVDGELPEGVSLDETGLFEGVPLRGGERNLQVLATDLATGERELRTIVLTIAEKEPVPTTVVRTVERGDEMAPLLAITEGNEFTAALVAGELPEGLTLNEDGTFGGVAERVGVVDSQILVRDEVTGDRELRSVAFEVIARAVNETDELRELTRGDELEPVRPAFDRFLVELAEGRLPAGLELSDDGTFGGTADEVGDFTVKVLFTEVGTGDRELLTLAMTVAEKEAVPVDDTLALRVAAPVEPLERINPDNPILAELVEGELPSGVTLHHDGSFEGMPTIDGTFTATILVSDDTTGDRELRTLVFEVAPATPVERIVLRTVLLGDEPADLDPVRSGSGFSAEIVSGDLPDGLSLAPNGELSGVAETPGSTSVTVMLVDDETGERELRTIVFNVAERPATETTRTAAGRVGEPLAPLAPLNDGNPLRATLVAGSLPDGVELMADGTFDGLPVESGDFELTVLLVDPVTFERELAVISMTVAAADPVEVQVSRIVDVGDAVAPLIPQSITAPFRAEVVDGELPDGLTLLDDGSFAGVAGEPGTFTFTVMLTSEVDGATERHAVTVRVEETATRTTEQVSVVKGSLIGDLEPINPGGDIEAELVSGTLPVGVSLLADGSLVGVPTEPGVYEAEILVTDPATGERELRTMTWVVANASPSGTLVPRWEPDTFNLGGPAAGSPSTATSSGGTTSRFGSTPENLAFAKDQSGGGTLAFTGAESSQLAMAGALLIAAGSLTVAGSRWRRRRLGDVD